jgi:hypothetical protein
VNLVWNCFFADSTFNCTQVRERMNTAVVQAHLACIRGRELLTSLLSFVAVIIIECNKFDSRYSNYFI